MTLTERLDQFDLAGQMILVIWTDAMQFIQQFLGDQFGRSVFHAVDDAMSHRSGRSELILLFEPINQEVYRRFVIVGSEIAPVLLMRGRVMECQIRPAQTDAVNLFIKSSPQRFANLLQCELDTRRAPIDRQDACVSRFHGSLLRHSATF
jgi:hypothetical protein